MHVMQLRVEKDPITGRALGKSCWNGHHQQTVVADEDAECCHEEWCECLCHERVADVDEAD